MKKGKLNFKIIIIFIVILIFVSYIYNYIVNTKEISNNTNNNYINKVDIVSKTNDFYRVKNSLNKFYLTCKSYNKPEDDEVFDVDVGEYDLENTLENIYDMLDSEYIEKYDVNLDNLKDKIVNFDKDSIQINDIYIIQKKDDIAMYLVQFTELIKETDGEKEYSFILKLDETNNIFSVYLNDFVIDEGYNNLKIGQKIKIDIKNIKTSNFNKYDNKVVYITEYQYDMFNEFKMCCMFNKNRAYEMVDDKSKQQKFSNFETFSNYIKSNFVKIASMNIEKVEVNNYDGYREFKYKTNKGLSFTFIETAPMKYTVIFN